MTNLKIAVVGSSNGAIVKFLADMNGNNNLADS